MAHPTDADRSDALPRVAAGANAALATEIYRARHRLGLTQGQLGASVGTDAGTVGTWERGIVPRARFFPKLAEALGLDVESLTRHLQPAIICEHKEAAAAV